jgi:pimeloyl-ACP methyl ester carboxylesterase
MGAPAPVVTLMRLAPPLWSRLKAAAHTLPYDLAIVGDTVTGKPLPAEPFASITTPTLVIAGSKSPVPLQQAAEALAEILPNATRRTLEGQSHNVSMKALAPVLSKFFV